MVRDGKFFPKDGGKEHDVTVEPVHVTPGGPFGSFIACVRNHTPKAVNAPILDGHYAAAICHLGNISYRLGKQVPFSQEPDGMSNPQVAESFEMIKRNLKGVGVNLDKATYCMGRTLTIDPKTERFIGDPEADKLLTQEYRAAVCGAGEGVGWVEHGRPGTWCVARTGPEQRDAFSGVRLRA